MRFRAFFEAAMKQNLANPNEPGVVKVLDNPNRQGSMLVYNIGPGFFLKPGQKVMLVIPEDYRHLVIRDMVLAHRKGPHGHGEPNMKWEPQKNKWRDYYGAYTKIEAHDTQTGTWHTYVDDYGAAFKFAEHRPHEFEEETLHDWIKIARVKPDLIRLTNPGNQRASSNPITGEKVDPMDERSTSEISTLKVIFFPNIDLTSKETKYYERIYAQVGGTQNAKTHFANYASTNELQPSYGNYGAGIYPNALVLASDWPRQSKRIKQVEGGWFFVMDKASFDKVSGDVGERVSRATGGSPGYEYHGREYVKVFPVTTNGGPGTNVSGGTLTIDIPQEMVGRKLLQVEVMCGDTEFRPDRIDSGKPWKRLGGALLSIGYQGQGGQQWFSQGTPVAPQMVASAAPQQPIVLSAGDKVLVKSAQDTTYVMGWRIAYS